MDFFFFTVMKKRSITKHRIFFAVIPTFDFGLMNFTITVSCPKMCKKFWYNWRCNNLME